MGIYFLLSELTFGITKYGPSGIFWTWNLVGVLASFIVGTLVLANRKSLTASIRFKTPGIDFNSLGCVLPRYKHHLLYPFINS
jgi:hypothetical protein